MMQRCGKSCGRKDKTRARESSLSRQSGQSNNTNTKTRVMEEASSSQHGKYTYSFLLHTTISLDGASNEALVYGRYAWNSSLNYWSMGDRLEISGTSNYVPLWKKKKLGLQWNGPYPGVP
ncbi:hypothetical protein Tco_1548309 [Tanacetum coccineum]